MLTLDLFRPLMFPMITFWRLPVSVIASARLRRPLRGKDGFTRGWRRAERLTVAAGGEPLCRRGSLLPIYRALWRTALARSTRRTHKHSRTWVLHDRLQVESRKGIRVHKLCNAASADTYSLQGFLLPQQGLHTCVCVFNVSQACVEGDVWTRRS